MTLSKLSINDLPSVYFDGCYRVLGYIPSTPESIVGFPMFGEGFVTTVQPQEVDWSWYKSPILNQGQTSSCVGHAACSGMENCYMQSGRKLVEFNPFFIYGLINHGRDAGSMISDALTALMQYGVCPKGDLQPGVMFQSQFPQKAVDDAKNYKLLQAFRCATFEDICSAITLGFFVPFGLMVGANFANLDGEGVAPLPAGGGGGHCILGVGLKKSSKYGWLVKFQNSWGSNYGLGGYGYIRKEHLRSMSPDAFAIQSVVDEPGDDDVPVATN